VKVPYIYTRRRWLILFGLADRIGYLLHRPTPGAPDLSEARSLLLVKLDQVGDLILTLPLIHALRRVAPSARLEVAVARGRSHVLEGVDDVDAVHELPVRMRAGEGRNEIRYAELWKAIRRLRGKGFDAVVSGKEDPATVLLTYLVGAPLRVGFIDGGLGFLLTHYVPIPSRSLHQWEILASLSGADPGAMSPPRYPIPETAAEEARAIEARTGADTTLPLVIVHPGAGIPERKWSGTNFSRVVSELSRKRPLRFLLVTGPEDESDDRVPEVAPPSRVTRLDRAVSLPVLAALLSRAAVLIGNESAPSHLAASVGTPAVVPFLYGTEPARWGPYGTGNRVLEGPLGKGPEPEVVAQAVAEVLGNRT